MVIFPFINRYLSLPGLFFLMVKEEKKGFVNIFFSSNMLLIFNFSIMAN